MEASPNAITNSADSPSATVSPAKGVLQQINAWPLTRKLATGAVLLISIGLFAFLILQGRTADQQLLYANLAEADAASVVAWLKNQKIPYSLKNGGKNIWIPADKIYESRLDLAANGLPTGGGVGFEIFDQQSFTLTDYVQKVNHTRALQGELARTITSLDPVEATRVHLALPEKRLFKDQQKKPSASVIVTLKEGKTLDQNQVQGIIHLVAGSIPDLEPENVKIIDSHGIELKSAEKADDGKMLSMDMLSFQQEVEQRMELRAQDLLDKTMGNDKAMVRVTATLDFAKNEKTEELYDAEEPVIRSEQVSTESSGSQSTGGVPGVQSNLQGNSASSSSTAPPSSKSSKTTNYEISKTLSTTVNPVGTVTKLSVSVLVADAMEVKEKDKPPVAVPRTPAELKSIESLVSTALGLAPQRGDQISVISMPFTDAPLLTDAVEGVGKNLLYEYLPLAKLAILPFTALLLYFFLVRPIVKTMRSEVTQHLKTVEQLQRERTEQVLAAQEEAVEPMMVDDEIIRIRREVMQNEVPSAYIIKNWIQEG